MRRFIEETNRSESMLSPSAWKIGSPNWTNYSGASEVCRTRKSLAKTSHERVAAFRSGANVDCMPAIAP
jgi:hypothetical protein